MILGAAREKLGHPHGLDNLLRTRSMTNNKREFKKILEKLGELSSSQNLCLLESNRV